MKSNASWVIEQRQAITSALLQLPASQRQVVELAYFSGLSQQEIASRLDSPLDTVKTRARLVLGRALQELHQAVFSTIRRRPMGVGTGTATVKSNVNGVPARH